MSDGQATVDLIHSIVSLEPGTILCEDAIEIEQRLFRKLSDENTTLRDKVEKLENELKTLKARIVEDKKIYNGQLKNAQEIAKKYEDRYFDATQESDQVTQTAINFYEAWQESLDKLSRYEELAKSVEVFQWTTSNHYFREDLAALKEDVKENSDCVCPIHRGGPCGCS